jgi:hypothetical protein
LPERDIVMPRDNDDAEQAKLTQGLVDRLLNKFPNASPGALERLAEEAKSNPIAASVIPSDWSQMAIDPAEPKALNGGQSIAPSLTYESVQWRMNEAMSAMGNQMAAQALGLQAGVRNGGAYETYQNLESQQSGNYPSYAWWGQSRENPPVASPAKIQKPKPLEIAAPTGKRKFLSDDEI